MLYRRSRTAFFIVGVLVVSTATAAASFQETRPRRSPRQDVEGLMEAYVISKLQEALELSDQQFAEMVVAQKKMSEHRRNFRREREKVLEQLRRLLGSPDGRDDEIAPLLKRLDDLQEELNSQQRGDYEAIDKILDVRQRARYRLLEQEIQGRFQQMVREIRRRQNPRPPRQQ
jgi:Spy/CpxP family protein refolding chaperone